MTEQCTFFNFYKLYIPGGMCEIFLYIYGSFEKYIVQLRAREINISGIVYPAMKTKTVDGWKCLQGVGPRRESDDVRAAIKSGFN